MAWKEAEAGDPLERVAVSLPADGESVREMAATFAEEFAAMGFGEQRLLRLFRSPRYAGAHHAWRILGDEEVRRIVAESVAVFGSVRFVVREAGGGGDEGRRMPPPVVTAEGGSEES